MMGICLSLADNLVGKKGTNIETDQCLKMMESEIQMLQSYRSTGKREAKFWNDFVQKWLQDVTSIQEIVTDLPLTQCL